MQIKANLPSDSDDKGDFALSFNEKLTFCLGVSLVLDEL